jgi:hypothetical protein
VNYRVAFTDQSPIRHIIHMLGAEQLSSAVHRPAAVKLRPAHHRIELLMCGNENSFNHVETVGVIGIKGLSRVVSRRSFLWLFFILGTYVGRKLQ